jgi:hypothetical protein
LRRSQKSKEIIVKDFSSSKSLRSIVSRLTAVASVALVAGLLLTATADQAHAGKSSKLYGCQTFSDGSGKCWGTVYNFRYGSTNTIDQFMVRDYQSFHWVFAYLNGGNYKMLTLADSDPSYKTFKPRLDRIIENPRLQFTIWWNTESRIREIELATDSADY